MKKVILIVGLLTSYTVTKAQNEDRGTDSIASNTINSDRPGISESPFLIAKGGLQLESGFNYEVDIDGNLKRQNTVVNSTLLRIGVSKNLELRLITEYLKNKQTNSELNTETKIQGANSVVIGANILISEANGSVPAISFHSYFRLPYLGKEEFRPASVIPTFKVAATHNLTDKISVSYNLGGTWNESTTGLYAICLESEVIKNTAVFIEGFGFFPDRSAASHGLNTGAYFRITDKVQVDLYGGLALTQNIPDQFFGGGFSWKVTK